METLSLAGVTHRRKSLRLLASLTTSLLVLATTTWPLATGFGSVQGPIIKPLASHTAGSRLSSKLMVATEQTVETDPLPELGKGGVYHISTPEQHKYVTLLVFNDLFLRSHCFTFALELFWKTIRTNC